MNNLLTHNLGFSYDLDSKSTTLTYADIQCTSNSPLLVSGKSGSGKTTFLHLLGGLLRPQTGIILVDGVDITALPAKSLDHFRGQHMGIVYQRPHFFPSLSVRDNILLAAHFSDREKRPNRVLALAERLQIGTLLSKRPAQLSLGEQQRVSLARALFNRPKMLLVDEPTSSLDQESCDTVMRLLLDQSYQAGAALVVITHDQRLQPYFTNRLQLS